MSHNRPAKSASLIEECDFIRKILRYSTFNSTLIFDLDNTILRPTHEEDLGSDQWFRKLLEHAISHFQHRPTAMKSALILNKSIQPHLKVKTVEPETSQIIKLLRDLKLTTIAVTARGPELMNVTFQQLEKLNVKFTDQDDHALIFYIEDKPIYFKNNILFCNGVNKGLCIEHLQRLNKLIQDHAVMLDDVEKNLHDVMQAFEKMGIQFVGLRYSHTDVRVTKFDLKRANVQLASVSSFFSQSVVNIIDELDLDGYPRVNP